MSAKKEKGTEKILKLETPPAKGPCPTPEVLRNPQTI